MCVNDSPPFNLVQSCSLCCKVLQLICLDLNIRIVAVFCLSKGHALVITSFPSYALQR